MPLYVLSAMKTHAFKLLSSSRQLDNKIYWAQKWLGIPFGKVPYLFYPRVYCITDILDVVGNQKSYGSDKTSVKWGFFTDESCQSMVKPKALAAHTQNITNGDVYIMDNGEYINLFVGSQIDQQFAEYVSSFSFISIF